MHLLYLSIDTEHRKYSNEKLSASRKSSSYKTVKNFTKSLYLPHKSSTTRHEQYCKSLAYL